MSVAQPQRSRLTCALRPAHGVLAPNAKLRALVVPQEVPQGPEPAAQATQPAECQANCAHHRPVRLSWAKLLKRVLATTSLEYKLGQR